jgi:hypothetical protein
VKKVIFGITIFVVLALAGCQPYWYWDPETYNFPHSETFKSVQEIVHWTTVNIDWVSDKSQYSDSEFWALPEQTYLRKEGDCEDFSILAMYFCHEIGVDTSLELVNLVFKDGVSGHAIFKAEGLYWEPQSGWAGGSVDLNAYAKKVWGPDLLAISLYSEISYDDAIRDAMDHKIIKRLKMHQQ